MRSQTKGHGIVAPMKHKQTKSSAAAARASALANTDTHDDYGGNDYGAQQSTSTIVVDPSLENDVHVVDGSLEPAHNGLAEAMGDPDQDNPSHSTIILSMPYNQNPFLRSSFSYVDEHSPGTLHPVGSGSGGGGGHDSDGADSPIRSNDGFLRASQSPEPDSSDPQYRSVRLPPILQVEKQHVTTTATQAASATRRKNEAVFKCPVPGCGSTFTRRFNLRGHLRSHTEERPFVCEWPGCGKGFARSHDCKRHTALHTAKHGAHVCAGCGKTFSRTDALNRHLKSEVGASCRDVVADAQVQHATSRHASAPIVDDGSNATPPPGSLSQIDVDSSLRPVPFAL